MTGLQSHWTACAINVSAVVKRLTLRLNAFRSRAEYADVEPQLLHPAALDVMSRYSAPREAAVEGRAGNRESDLQASEATMVEAPPARH